MLALTDAATVVVAVAAAFVVVCLLVFARLMLAKVPPTYRRYRFGVFVERNGNHTTERREGDARGEP